MKKILIIFTVCLLLSGCSPANQPGEAEPSDVVDKTEQESLNTIADNKSESTKPPKRETPTVTPEKTDDVTPEKTDDVTPEKEEQLPEKLKAPSFTHLTIWGGKNSPAYLGVYYAKDFVDEVLLKAIPIKASKAKTADYPLSCLLYHDGTFTEYMVDPSAKQLKVGEDQYRLPDRSIAKLSEMITPPDLNRDAMTAVELNKDFLRKEDGIYIKVTAAYPDRFFAVLEKDSSVSVEVLSNEIPMANDLLAVASLKYWKSADGKQLFFDQSAEVHTRDNWERSFTIDYKENSRDSGGFPCINL